MFFSNKIKKKIKALESREVIYKNFLSQKEINQLLKIEQNSKKFFVNKPEGRKRSLGIKGDKVVRNPNNWHPVIKRIILPKLKKIFPHFKITKDEFPPHFFNNEYPTVMHADTGRNKDAIIYKQILIPLKIFSKKKILKNHVSTIIFNRRWYGPACTFRYSKTNLKDYNYDYTLKDSNSKFIKIKNLKKFNSEIEKLNNTKFIYNGGKFYINNSFKNNLLKIIKSSKKRYNQFSNKHIINSKKFDKKLYTKYLTHQPRDDFQSLKIDTLYDWKYGDMLVWDRSKLHASNNYSKYGIKRKIGFSIFFSV